MKPRAVILVFAVVIVKYVAAVSLPHQACNELASQFPSQLFFPDSLRYVNESNSKPISYHAIDIVFRYSIDNLKYMLSFKQPFGPRIVCCHHGASLRLIQQKM